MNLTKLVLMASCLVLVGCGGSGGRSNNAPAVNQAPSVVTEDNVVVVANGSISATITVNDDRTLARDLTVTAQAVNPALFGAGAVVITGAGADRQITLTPQPDEIGSTLIEVAVADTQGLSSMAQINVAVRALQRQAAAFSRDLAMIDEAEAPLLLNAIVIADDAEEDDFADLLDL